MSAISGIVHLDGGRVALRDLEPVLGSLYFQRQTPRTMTAGGSCLSTSGLASDYVPRTCLNGSAVITVSARLDNRSELLESLGLASEASPTDESLVVSAYERWGEVCPERLNGDWVLAVWLPEQMRLFLARDHFGNTGLFFARVGPVVAFSTDLQALLCLPSLPRALNETRMSSLLAGWAVDVPRSTVYRDISRVPPAHTLTMTAGEERLQRYWKVEETPDSGPSDPHERATMLRETLRGAVGTRLEGAPQVGSLLSGGLDSGAVTALAGEYLSPHRRRMTAFTSVPAFAPDEREVRGVCFDEGPPAAEIAKCFDTIDHVRVTAGSVGPVAALRRGLAMVGEPSIAAASYVWVTEAMGDARARGIDVMLTGQVGDFVMSGRLPESNWREDWAERSVRKMLKRLAPSAIQRLRDVNLRPGRWGEAPWRDSSVVHKDFAAETRLLERFRDRRRTSLIVRQATSEVGAHWSAIGAHFGLSVRDPLQDKRVMQQMFAAPRPPSVKGVDRWLFRQSLAGILPEPVRTNRRKCVQSADIVERLRATWPEVEDALAVAEASPLARRCIDLDYCRQLAGSLKSEDAPRPARRRAFTLLNGISAALFLAETWK